MMIDIKIVLAEAKKTRQALIDRINQLAEQRQTLLQEALRLDGEIRVLQRLDGADNVKEKEAAKAEEVKTA